MNYIVFDLEWNQSPNGKKYEVTELPFEIIEIGAVKLNSNKEVIDDFHRIIKPQVYLKLHSIIERLTSFSEEELSLGVDFEEAYVDFIKWCGKDYRFCIWGSSDILELQRNAEYFKVKSNIKFPLYYYDIQKIYSIGYQDGKRRSSLEQIVDELKIDYNDDFHRAIGDAIYTAKVMKSIDFEQYKNMFSIDLFRNKRNENKDIYVIYPTYSKYISKVFDDKIQAMRDQKIQLITCHKCGRKLTKKIEWFSDNSKIYYSLSYCPEHGYIKGKLKMRHTDDGRVFVVKTLKITDMSGIQFVIEKQERIRMKRWERRHNSP